MENLKTKLEVIKKVEEIGCHNTANAMREFLKHLLLDKIENDKIQR